MSQESAVAFYEKLESDTSLMEQLREMTRPEAEKLVKQDLGYDFTKEEMQQVIFEHHPELTDEELEAVVGGLKTEEAILIGGAILGAGVIGAGIVGAGVGYLFVVAVAAA